MTEKACATCRHRVLKAFETLGSCGHPGAPKTQMNTAPRCMWMRSPRGACGQEGTMWEKATDPLKNRIYVKEGASA